MSITPVRSNRAACLAALRRRVAVIEHGYSGPADNAAPAADTPFMRRSAADPAALDPFLADGGEAPPALYELVADSYGGRPAARDFALALTAALLHRRPSDQGMVLWCQRRLDALEFGHPYGPGLRTLGLAPDRLLMVTGRRDADCLWAMEQGLASRSLLAVVGAVERVDLTASRRLSLAAAAHRTPCLLLPLQHGREPSAARTRWRIKPAPSLPDHLDPKGLGLPCWQLALERSPGGRTGHWIVEWDHATHHFHLAAARRHDPVARRDSPVARRDGPDRQASDVIAFDRTG
ncbi:MAG: hypothetical protein OEU92_29790 [Alphaproteobacteria bacterium]|nr:hypothetical protein [Alphaproteobacteria bacterium]